MTQFLGTGQTEIGEYHYYERDGQVYSQKELGPFVWCCSYPAWERTFHTVLKYVPATVIAKWWTGLHGDVKYQILNTNFVWNVVSDCMSGPFYKNFFHLQATVQAVIRVYYETTVL